MIKKITAGFTATLFLVLLTSTASARILNDADLTPMENLRIEAQAQGMENANTRKHIEMMRKRLDKLETLVVRQHSEIERLKVLTDPSFAAAAAPLD